MTSASFQKATGNLTRITSVFWWALTASVGIYVYVAWYFTQKNLEPVPLEPAFLYAMSAVAVVTGLFALGVPRFMLSD